MILFSLEDLLQLTSSCRGSSRYPNKYDIQWAVHVFPYAVAVYGNVHFQHAT